MVVYICCAGGATSGLFCTHVQKSAIEDGKNCYVDDIYTVCSMLKKGELKEYDLILAYGPAGSINNTFIKENNIIGNIDLVLVSPQVRFTINNIKELLEPRGIPCELLEMRAFGMMDGKKGLEEIKKFL